MRRTVTLSPRVDPFVIGVVALVARLPAYLTHTYPSFDDATYGMSTVLMRDGALPFRDVFSSQGPLHLSILYVGDLLGGRTSVSPRTAMVIAGVTAAVVAVFLGRRVGGRAGGVLAGVVVALSGSMLWTTAPITSDGLSVALVAIGFLLALRYLDQPSAGRAALAAIPLAAALLVKPATSAFAVLGALIVIGSRRAWSHLAVMAGVAVALALASSLPFGIADVWDQSVRYQLDSRREATIGQNASKLVTTLWSRDVVLLAVAALALVTVAARRRDRATPASSRAEAAESGPPRVVLVALYVWTGTLLVFLVVQPALWRNHVSSLIVPVAVLAAAARPSWRAVAAVLVVVLPLHLLFVRSILHPEPLRGASRDAVRALQQLPASAQVITDEIGLVWRSGRSTAPDLVDTSIKQFEQGRITTRRIARAATRPEVCAVLVWKPAYFGSLTTLPAELARDGYVVAQRFPGSRGVRVLYRRATTTCPAA